MFLPQTKFLVVDDFATMRKIVRTALGEIGYTNVEEAESGAQALEMLNKALHNQTPFDFVISDWSMPEMAGIDLLKKCRQSPALKALPFMLVTAESEQKNIIQAAKAGVSDYLVKPFTAATLKEKLERIQTRLAATKTA